MNKTQNYQIYMPRYKNHFRGKGESFLLDIFPVSRVEQPGVITNSEHHKFSLFFVAFFDSRVHTLAVR